MTARQVGSAQSDPTLDLVNNRIRNDRRLKGRFESIFEKYAKDFSHIGDEIDLETGRIVTNNGHLAQMQNEQDVGSSASSRFVKAFGEEVMKGGVGTHMPVHHAVRTIPSNHSMTASVEHDMDSGANHDHAQSYDADSEDDAESDDSVDDPETTPSHAQDPSLTEELFNTLPSIEDSLTALVPRNLPPGEPFTIDPAAVNALGQNIANQIAQFLSNLRNPFLPPKPINPWEAPPLPQDAFAPPRYPGVRDATPVSSSVSSRFQSPSAGQSIWGPPEAYAVPRPHKRLKVRHVDETLINVDPRLGEHQRDRGLEADLSDGSRQTSVEPFSEYHKTQAIYASGRRNVAFTAKEDNYIKRLKEIHKLKMSEIETLTGRSKQSLANRYFRVIRHLPLAQGPGDDREFVEILDDERDDQSGNEILGSHAQPNAYSNAAGSFPPPNQAPVNPAQRLSTSSDAEREETAILEPDGNPDRERTSSLQYDKPSGGNDSHRVRGNILPHIGDSNITQTDDAPPMMESTESTIDTSTTERRHSRNISTEHLTPKANPNFVNQDHMVPRPRDEKCRRCVRNGNICIFDNGFDKPCETCRRIKRTCTMNKLGLITFDYDKQKNVTRSPAGRFQKAESTGNHEGPAMQQGQPKDQEASKKRGSDQMDRMPREATSIGPSPLQAGRQNAPYFNTTQLARNLARVPGENMPTTPQTVPSSLVPTPVSVNHTSSPSVPAPLLRRPLESTQGITYVQTPVAPTAPMGLGRPLSGTKSDELRSSAVRASRPSPVSKQGTPLAAVRKIQTRPVQVQVDDSMSEDELA